MNVIVVWDYKFIIGIKKNMTNRITMNIKNGRINVAILQTMKINFKYIFNEAPHSRAAEYNE